MRIMHISTRLILGGSQENTVLSCIGQAEDGHDVSLVFGPIYGPEGSLLERVKEHGGIEPIETPHLVRELAPMRDFRCMRDLRRLVRAWKPDVVHTHSSKAGILGRGAAWKEGVPAVIHTIHGLAFHPYQARWRHAIYVLSERWAAKRCHRIACVADAMRDQALAEGIGWPELYTTVYSGMEVDRFLDPGVTRAEVRGQLGLDDEALVIGTVSRLAELKGHDDLLDAAEPLLRAHEHLRLLWVGDGWWADRLLGRVRGMGLEGRVIHTGLVPPERIPELLRAMDVLVHPSYREGLPRAVTQGLLAGLPVVANDVDGTKEVCIPGETGRLVRPGDVEDLRDALAWMIEHPEERKAMGERGRALCAERFDWRAMVRVLDGLYREVLVGSGGAQGR